MLFCAGAAKQVGKYDLSTVDTKRSVNFVEKIECAGAFKHVMIYVTKLK